MIKISNNIYLKPLSLNDSTIIYDIVNNQRLYLREWLPFVDTTKDETDIQSFIKDSLSKEELQYIIYYQHVFCGLIGFNNTDRTNNKTEIGYWISKDVQGKGIITQSVPKLIDLAFDKLNLNKVTIKVAVSNFKSRKIPERLNFIFEGIEREAELLVNNKYTDLAIYSLLKKEYKR